MTILGRPTFFVVVETDKICFPSTYPVILLDYLE